MSRPEKITTSDAELAVALMTATRKRPTCIYSGAECVEFSFPANDITEAVAQKYAAGTLVLNVRRLASYRAWILKQCGEVARTGGVAYAD